MTPSISKLLSLAFLLGAASLWSQQDPNYTFYRYNMNLINPAYAGAGEGSELGLNFRTQWSGVEGAPETQSVFFSTPLANNIGIGASIINDQTFIEKQTSLVIDVSYKVTIDRTTNLFMGIKAGANSYNVNTKGLNTIGSMADPSLSNIDGRFSPNIGAGLYLKGEQYFVSFSMPKLLSPERLESLNGEVKLGRNRMHTYLGAGYDISLGDGLVLKPATLLRYVAASPLSVDLTAGLEIKESFELGASYRLDEGIGLFGIINFASWAEFGYVYEVAGNNALTGVTGSTHEIMINFKF